MTNKDKSTNGKNLFEMQTLDLAQGAVRTIAATGSDAEAAADGLARFVNELK